jgi:hypothetical protein
MDIDMRLNKMDKAKGWAAYEEIGIGIPNFNFGEHSPEEASLLVSQGKMRFAICQGMALTLVPLDYELKDYEYFVRREGNRYVEEK